MTRFQHIFYWLLLVFLGILSVSGTIALRNSLHLILLCMFVWALLDSKQRKAMRLHSLVQGVPPAVWAWMVFLLLFPFMAVEPDVAWRELLLHWSESLLTWVLAFAAVAVLRGATPKLLTLTFASAVPVLIHLTLVPLFMVGLLRGEFGADPSLFTLGETLWSQFQHLDSVKLEWQSILGFRGIEPMHGNIGYPASQTLVLALACWLQARRNKNSYEMVASLSLIFACLLSGLISSSRGTVIFNLLLLFIAFCVSMLVSHSQSRKILNEANPVMPWKFMFTLAGLLATVVCLLFLLVKSDERWQTMVTKIQMGLSIEYPLERLCDGLDVNDHAAIRAQAQGRGEQYEYALTSGLEGQDGARMLLLRAGVNLVAAHPRGQDGSRESFEKIMAQTCGHTPKLAFAHAHNAWINLALSLGWMGVMLFAWLLLSFFKEGWNILRHQDNTYPVGYALLLLAIFWIFRGMTDAVYQEHYMQMQAFFLGVLLLNTRLID